jgi:hypothetical protein
MVETTPRTCRRSDYWLASALIALGLLAGCAAPVPRPVPAAADIPTPPAAPRGPVVGVLTAGSTLTLSWTNGVVAPGQPNPTQTDVERTTETDPANCSNLTPGWTNIASVAWPAAGYADTTVIIGTVYCYRVKAVALQNGAPPLSSAYSNIAGATAGGTAPPGTLPAPVLQSITARLRRAEGGPS